MQYYDQEKVCGKCGLQTRQAGPVVDGKPKCIKPDCKGTLFPKYDTVALYTQLCYFRDLFDIDRAVHRSNLTDNVKGTAVLLSLSFSPSPPVELLRHLGDSFPSERAAFSAAKDTATKIVAANAYNIVQLAPLFSFFKA